MSRLRWKWKMAPGQSVIFLVLIILILIAFTGLAIDTSRAFQRQRTIQAASNAGAISGMNVAAQNGTTHNQVSTAIRNAMLANGIKDLQQVNNYNWGANPNTTYYSAAYLDGNGEFLAWVSNGSDLVPDEVAFIRVTTSEGVETSFSKAVGQEEFRVSADGTAGLTPCVTGVLPITFHENYLVDPPPSRQPLHSAYWNAESSELLKPAYARSVIRVDRDTGHGNFLWLSWLNNNASNSELDSSMTWPGNLSKGFIEAEPPPGDTVAVGQINRKLEIGDWMGGTPGNRSANDDVVQWYITNKTPVILPLHDQYEGNGNNRKYHVSQFITVRILEWSSKGSDRYFKFALLNTSPMCVTQTPGDPPQPPKNFVTVSVQEELRWYNPGELGSNYNIAMVMDYSGSMNRCWASETDCPVGSRRVDYQIPAARRFVEEMLITRNGGGSDNQMSLIRFNDKGASTLVPFTSDPNPFWSKIGAPGSSYTVPKNDLQGWTPTAHGLNAAVGQLNASRKVDKNGNPVKLVVVILTDGLANVFFDAPYNGQVNSNTGPFGKDTPPGKRGPEWYPCVRGSGATDDPYYQATCPTGKSVPSPIYAAIEQANIGRESGMVFYAIALAQPNGMGVEDLYLDRMADKAFLANSQASIDAALETIAQDLDQACDEVKEVPRPAAGATVTVYRQDGGIQATATLDANGRATMELPAATYSIGVSHLGVVAPEDPRKIARNYTRLLPTGVSEPVATAPMVVPDDKTVYEHPEVLLVLDNYANAQCPTP